jgi:hypothetical protein
MRRSLLAIVMGVIFSAVMLQAQRGGGGTGHSGAAHATVSHAAVVNRSAGGIGVTGGPEGNRSRRRGYWYGYGYGAWPGYYGGYGLDWGLPYWDYVNFPPTGIPGPDDEAPAYTAGPASRVAAVTRERAPATPVESPKVIEVPLPKDAVVKPQPPALFVLTSGEKLESRRYVLSADALQIDVDRKQRTIPISELNMNATIAANQQRGIDVSFPQDRSSLFVGF